VLFDKLDLPVKKRTKSGPSTDQSVLEQLAELHDLPDLILEFRSFSKLKGTYVDALPTLIREDTGRIHTDFNQAVTATGRLSSSNPNLQNIPVRSVRGREIRKAFVPEEGWTMIVADYSQIELRIMAHLSGDAKLVDAYKTGVDVHRLTASQVFDVPIDEVTDDQRAAAKTINFGVMYGMGSSRLARDLGISNKEARQYIDAYFERYAGVKEFFDRLKFDARANGFAETMFGRRRIMDELFDGTRRQRSFAERVAVNMPIQGTAADIIKLAMIELDQEIEEKDLQLRMLLQVHDELVFECPPDISDEAAELVRDRMEGVAELDVPLEVDLGTGASWYEAK
jgi:DNA polymerase-1